MDGLAIAASLTEMRRAIVGGQVQAVYQPTREVVLLHIYAGKGLRVLLAPRLAAAHVTELDLPNPAKPSAFAMLLRRHLRGGRVLAIRQRGWDRILSFDIERRQGRSIRRLELRAELVGLRGNLFLLQDGRIVGAVHRDRRNAPGQTYRPLPPQPKLDPASLSEASIEERLVGRTPIDVLTREVDGIGKATARDLLASIGADVEGSALARELVGAVTGALRYVEDPEPCVIPTGRRATFYPVGEGCESAGTIGQALDRVFEVRVGDWTPEEDADRAQLLRERARRERALVKLREWMEGAEEAERLQRLADVLMIHHTDVEPKATSAVLLDPSSNEELTIRLDPSRSALENATQLYERAKRLRRGRGHVRVRMERMERELTLLHKALDAIDRGEVLDDDMIALLRPPTETKAPRRQDPTPRVVELDGFRVRIGRSAQENDRLLRDAAPGDLWLHAKGVAGSHVIVTRGGRREIPDSVVEGAARLAARHSKARGEKRVEVLVTEARNVRKPKGAPAGLANVLRGDTLTIEL